MNVARIILLCIDLRHSLHREKLREHVKRRDYYEKTYKQGRTVGYRYTA